MPAPVFIMRGISGSGKSYQANLIKTAWDETITLFADPNIGNLCPCYIVSADHYFTRPDGSYHFDGSKLKEAHAACKGMFDAALEDPHAAIIVDNTNTRRWEYNDYVVKAKAAGRPVQILEIHTLPPVAAARNTHGLTEAMIWKQFDRFEADPNGIIITGE